MKFRCEKGDIVQLDPNNTDNPMFAGCLMVADEVREWGVIGYVQGLGKDMKPGGRVYYRADWKEIEPTGGRAPWVVE